MSWRSRRSSWRDWALAALGIAMAAPFFKVRDLIRCEKVTVFSSNYPLYGDMSRRMNETLTGTAELQPLEPNLRMRLGCGSTGQLLTEIALTPDHPTQTHTFELELDQTYLPGIIRQLETILERFPVRGRPD